MDRYVLAIAVLMAVPTLGQQCPQSNNPSQSLTLEGRLVYHDGIRKWFELKLDEPRCGQTSVELVREVPDWTPLQVLRGCRVRSGGSIAFSPTGYYSLDTFQGVDEIEPVGTCVRQMPFPDDPKAKPDKSVRSYRVDMQIKYDGDHPILFHVSSGGKELKPWQAYAHYYFTGGFVLYGYCGEGFVINRVFGTPQAHPEHLEEPRTPEDAAIFDPESAATSGKNDLHLAYTCLRD